MRVLHLKGSKSEVRQCGLVAPEDDHSSFDCSGVQVMVPVDRTNSEGCRDGVAIKPGFKLWIYFLNQFYSSGTNLLLFSCSRTSNKKWNIASVQEPQSVQEHLSLPSTRRFRTNGAWIANTRAFSGETRHCMYAYTCAIRVENKKKLSFLSQCLFWQRMKF